MDLQEAVTMARGLLAEHGLDGWRVGLDRAKRRWAYCRFPDRLISLSAPLTRLHSEAEIRETILHEIAHALVGPAHGHDETWRRRAIAIGATGDRCAPADAPTVNGPFIGTCPAGHEITRHRRPESVGSCQRCSPAFDARHLFAWSRDGAPIRLHPRYVSELVQLRRTSTSPLLARQLDVDRRLGGGAGHPSVRALLRERLRPGTRVRLLPAAGKHAGVRGVVVAWARTKYRVRSENGREYGVPPEFVEAV